MASMPILLDFVLFIQLALVCNYVYVSVCARECKCPWLCVT